MPRFSLQLPYRLGGIFAGCLALVLSSCVTTLAPPAGNEDLGSDDALAAWGQLLADRVNDKGQVDFIGVAKSPDNLNSYVKFLTRNGPLSQPEAYKDRDVLLAYYLNSYNALAMYGVIQYEIPAGFNSILQRANFFKFTEYTLDQRQINLFDYENNVIRKFGDPRIHFALNCMSVGCPRLPKTPFEAATLQEDLDAAAKEFFNSEKYVQVNEAQKQVLLSEILSFFTEDFVNEKHATSLIAYVNRYRENKIPEFYEVDFIPYDWNINKQ